MEFTEKSYPVDKSIFNRIMFKRNLTQVEISKRLGYGKSAIGMGLCAGRFSRRIAVGLYDAYSITPNDYAPKVATTVKKEDERTEIAKKALIEDGIYTLQIAEVREVYRGSNFPEGWKFITVTNDRRPFYFTFYDRNADGSENMAGAYWMQHFLRTVLGENRDDIRPDEAVGKKVRAYINQYSKENKVYNRLLWSENIEQQEKPIKWQDAVNADSPDETIWEVAEYALDELSLRYRRS